MKSNIEEIENRNYVNFENVFIQTLENHAPLKKKIVRANHAPYMTKTFRKAIMRRSALENTFHKNNTIENNKAYKKHKNYCSRLYKKVRRQYYANLNHSNITDNTKFWKTGQSQQNIIIVDSEKIYSDDKEVAEMLNNLFYNAVSELGILDNPITINTKGCDDTIEAIL